MPRQAKAARLYQRGNRWLILDRGKQIATGAGSREEAEEALARYIRGKPHEYHSVEPHEITCGEILEIYATEHAPTAADPARIGNAIIALAPFWSDLKASAIKGETCRRYMKWRAKAPGTMRRELGTLQAAINHCHREGYVVSAPTVTLPEKPPARDRWLTRREIYWMLRAARSLRIDGRHLQWFIIASIYTGTRKQAVLNLEITSTPTLHHGRMDPATGMLHRRGESERITKKRRNPARMPRQLWAHARRKQALGHRWFVQDHTGNRLGDVKHGWQGMLAKAMGMAAQAAEKHGDDSIAIDLSGVTMHTLKHTAITWAMQRGVSTWEAAGYFSTSPDTIERVYGHHSVDFQANAVAAMERRK